MSYGDLTAAQSCSPYAGEKLGMARMPTLQERLDLAVSTAEKQLSDTKEAREIFKRNPDLERLLDLMQKGRF